MATLTAFLATDMSASIFVDDAGARMFASTSMKFFESGGEREWDFVCNGVLPTDGSRPVQGFANESAYFSNGTKVFEIVGLDSPPHTAQMVFDLFEAGGDVGLFGYLLSGNDKLIGSAEDDLLNGGDGNDNMLGASGADSLTGGRGADTLRGAAGNDRLEGAGNGDRLEGGAGRDTMFGGAGADDFVFNTTPKSALPDRIADFEHRVDQILLDHGVFAELAPGVLPASVFVAGNIGPNSTAGIGPEDRVLYDKDSGDLYYDSNGSGAGGRVLLATILDGHGLPAILGPVDFHVI